MVEEMSWHSVAMLLLLLLSVGMFWKIDLPSPKGKKDQWIKARKGF
jgi:hypothetical protein